MNSTVAIIGVYCCLISIVIAQVQPPDLSPEITNLRAAGDNLSKSAQQIVNSLNPTSQHALSNFMSQYLKMIADGVNALDHNTGSLVKVVTQLRLSEYKQQQLKKAG